MDKMLRQMYLDWQNSEISSTFDLYCYERGRADALNIDMEKPMHFTAEQKAWVKNYIIQNAKSVRADERERIIKKLEEKLSEKKYQHDGEDYYVGISEALEIVGGKENI